MPGRKFGNEGRYGFNGKEKDKDIAIYIYDFGERIYDGRIARFLSVDPLTKDYPSFSPYLYGANNPIEFIEIFGLGPGDPPLDFVGKWQYRGIIDVATGKNNRSLTRWSMAGLAQPSIQAIYDNVSKQHYFVTKDIAGQYYYWKANAGEDQTHIREHTKNGKTTWNGTWESFETQDSKQAKVAAKSADLIATFFVACFTTIAGGIAIEGALSTYGSSAVTSAIVNTAKEEIVETVVETVTGIPVVMNPADIVKYGYRKVLRGEVKDKIVSKYGKNVAKGSGSYTIKYADGTSYHGAGNVEEVITRAYKKSDKKNPNDIVTNVDWTPSPSKGQQFRDEAKRLNGDGGYNSPTNRNQTNSPGNVKYKDPTKDY